MHGVRPPPLKAIKNPVLYGLVKNPTPHLCFFPHSVSFLLLTAPLNGLKKLFQFEWVWRKSQKMLRDMLLSWGQMCTLVQRMSGLRCTLGSHSGSLWVHVELQHKLWRWWMFRDFRKLSAPTHSAWASRLSGWRITTGWHKQPIPKNAGSSCFLSHSASVCSNIQVWSEDDKKADPEDRVHCL